MKRDGAVPLRTPAMLKATPRIRQLVSGFPDLFAPLPVGKDQLNSMWGHITPNLYFYLARPSGRRI